MAQLGQKPAAHNDGVVNRILSFKRASVELMLVIFPSVIDAYRHMKQFHLFFVIVRLWPR
jgi:hypothetical protein